jgi:hypothetical protein
MKHSDLIPRKDKDLGTWARNLLVYVSTSVKTAGIPEEEVSAVTRLFLIFDEALKTVEDLDRHTPVAVGAKREARAENEVAFEQFGMEKLVTGGFACQPGVRFDYLSRLLWLCDTSDPVKYFGSVRTPHLLAKLDIPVKRPVVIEVLDDCLLCEPWFGGMKALEDWLGVFVEVNGNQVSIGQIEDITA